MKVRFQPKNVISLNTVSAYKDYVVTWFANAATRILMNKSIYEVTQSDLSDLHRNASSYFSERNVESIPLLLTPNDRADDLRISKAIDMLYEASRGNTRILPLPPALSFEYAEYLRVFSPQPKSGTLKREALGVSSEILALAILGAGITQAYQLIERGDKGRREYGYIFLDLYNPEAISVDLNKLNVSARLIARQIMEGDGSPLALYVGVAASIVLYVGRNLDSIEGRTFYSTIRVTRSENKVMLKAFEFLDLTLLAKTIRRLNIALAIFELMTSYPKEEGEEQRALRSFIENLSRAIMIYHNLCGAMGRGSCNATEELYKVLRTLTSELFYQKLSRYLGEKWGDIYSQLLNIRT